MLSKYICNKTGIIQLVVKLSILQCIVEGEEKKLAFQSFLLNENSRRHSYFVFPQDITFSGVLYHLK